MYDNTIFSSHYTNVIYRIQQILIEHNLDFDIAVSEVPILKVLYDAGAEGVLQDDMVVKLVLAKSGVSRTIKNLEAKGLVYRKDSEENKKYKKVYPSEKFLAYGNIFEKMNKATAEIYANALTKEDIEQFRILSEKLSIAYREYKKSK